MAKLKSRKTEKDAPGQKLLLDGAELVLPAIQRSELALPPEKPRKVAERFPYLGYEIPLHDSAMHYPIEQMRSAEREWQKERRAARMEAKKAAAGIVSDTPIMASNQMPAPARGPFVVKSFRDLCSRVMPNSVLKVDQMWDPTTTSDERKQQIGLAQLEFFELLAFMPRTAPPRWLLQGPTSAGKTYIALTFLELMRSRCSEEKKHVIVTPDKDLILQLLKDSAAVLGLEERRIGVSGRAAPDTREKRWGDNNKAFYLYTPGTFLNDVERGIIDPATLGSVVLDEVHHYFDGIPRKPDPAYQPTPHGLVYSRLVQVLSTHDVAILGQSATPGPTGSNDIEFLRMALGFKGSYAHYFPMNLPPHKVSEEETILPIDKFYDSRHNHKILWGAVRLLEGARIHYDRVQRELAKISDLEAQLLESGQSPFENEDPYKGTKLERSFRRTCTCFIDQPKILPADDAPRPESRDVFEELCEIMQTELDKPLKEHFRLPSQGYSIRFCEALGRFVPPSQYQGKWHRVVMDAWRLEHYRRMHAKLTGCGIAALLRDIAENIIEVKYGVPPELFGKRKTTRWKGPSPTKLGLFNRLQSSFDDPESFSHAITVYRYFACGAPRLDPITNLPLRGEDGKALDSPRHYRYMDLLNFDSIRTLQQERYPHMKDASDGDIAKTFLADAQAELVAERLKWKDHPKMVLLLQCLKFYFRSGRLGKVMIKTNFVGQGRFMQCFLPMALDDMGFRNHDIHFIEGTMKSRHRRETLEKFHTPSRLDGKVRILILCELGSEGRHDPEVDWMIFMQPPWNFKRRKQGGGRPGRDPSSPRSFGRTAFDKIALAHVIVMSMGPGSEDFLRLMAGRASVRKVTREYESYHRAVLYELEALRASFSLDSPVPFSGQEPSLYNLK